MKREQAFSPRELVDRENPVGRALEVLKNITQDCARLDKIKPDSSLILSPKDISDLALPPIEEATVLRSIQANPRSKKLSRTFFSGMLTLMLSAEQTLANSTTETLVSDTRAIIAATSSEIQLSISEDFDEDKGRYWYRFNCSPNEEVNVTEAGQGKFLYVDCKNRRMFDATCSGDFVPQYYTKYPDQSDDGIKEFNRKFGFNSRIIFWCESKSAPPSPEHLRPPENFLWSEGSELNTKTPISPQDGTVQKEKF